MSSLVIDVKDVTSCLSAPSANVIDMEDGTNIMIDRIAEIAIRLDSNPIKHLQTNGSPFLPTSYPRYRPRVNSSRWLSPQTTSTSTHGLDSLCSELWGIRKIK